LTIDWKLTADAVATLIAGLAAFVAVILQIRSSSKSVTEQMEAEKNSRMEAESREKQAVARALLFEIVNFYRIYQEQVRKPLAPGGSVFPTLGSPGVGVFAVYRANAGKLGHFDDRIVESVVTFYVEAEWFVSALEDFNESVYQELRLYKTINMGSAPLVYLSRLKERMPILEQGAHAACRNLCPISGVSYDSLQLPN
jgi:hypothetical protein